jgi:inorganic triphosphatase YgiF
MGEEVELKLEVAAGSAGQLFSVEGLGGPWASQRQVSVYFDGPDREVRSLGCTLRVREGGGRFVQTVKSVEGGAGLFQRGEWEYEIAGPEPDRDRLTHTPLARLGPAKLAPIVRSEVTRRSRRLPGDGALIEIVLDEGKMRAGERELPVCEIELELIEGDPAAMFALARRIAARVPVRLGVMSKAERGFALADGRLGKIAKAEPVPLNEEMIAADGFAAILAACVRHFRLNEPLVTERRLPEALHQCRVAMRRLRSALTLFRTAVGDPEFARLREELRWFTGELGDARNLDVFLGRELAAKERKAIEARRQAAYDRVAAAMDSQPVRTLMLDLVAWSRLGEWRGHADAQRALEPYVSHRIDRLWRRIGHARDIEDMDDEQRHRLRIEVKKLRYALEFTEALYARERDAQRRFARAIETLQEALGDLNDVVVARTLVASDAWPIAPNRAGERELALLRDAEDALHHLRRIGPYWRGSE